MSTLVQETVTAIRTAVQKRINHLKGLEAMAVKTGNTAVTIEMRGGIDELELLMANLPKETK